MRSAVLLCLVLTGCAGSAATTDYNGDPLAATNLGCWSLRTINWRTRWIPNPTIVRLDYELSENAPNKTYNRLVRLTTIPNGVTEEVNYWYALPGDRQIRMVLGDATGGVSIEFTPSKQEGRMDGRAGSGATASVRALRVDCP